MKVSIIAVLTADGLIAKHSDHLADWSSKEDKQLFVRLTKRAGVMVMGSNQFKTINRALPGRRTIVYSRNPDFKVPDGVEVTTESPQTLIDRLARDGVSELAICGGAQIYDLFFEAGVVTDLYLSYEPLLFGSGLHVLTGSYEQKLELCELEKLGDNAFYAHYQVI